jgi:hypothetical protein
MIGAYGGQGKRRPESLRASSDGSSFDCGRQRFRQPSIPVGAAMVNRIRGLMRVSALVLC